MGAGIVGWEVVTNTVTNSSDKTVNATCDTPGNSVLGGGYRVQAGSASDLAKITVVANYPSGATTWTVQAVETASVAGNWSLTVYGACGVA
jgi:hypothetical protein